jgi:hypothetical protein
MGSGGAASMSIDAKIRVWKVWGWIQAQLREKAA